MAITLEIAVDNTPDAMVAAAGGADRLELAAALDQHGLTPRPDIIREIKAAVTIPVLVLIRPGPHPVIQAQAEVAAALKHAEQSIDAGADGLVFGFLRPDRTIDRDLAIAVRAIAAPRDTVFHRAFDLTPDPFDAIDQLAALGITRILTAGQTPGGAARAMNLDTPEIPAEPPVDPAADPDLARFERIRHYRRHAGDRIQILPGGGIRAVNIATLFYSTGADQVHSSARTPSRAGLDPVELRGLRAALDGLAR
ncbi:MAG: hypothetical protein IT436_03295 [Phycisphaerales bacterium]|nr:hypothetical protein [Phycisphaerales bacterium]